MNELNITLKTRLYFPDLINQPNYRTALEVGVYEGKYAIHFLEMCPQLSITQVDAWMELGGKILMIQRLFFLKY